MTFWGTFSDSHQWRENFFEKSSGKPERFQKFWKYTWWADFQKSSEKARTVSIFLAIYQMWANFSETRSAKNWTLFKILAIYPVDNFFWKNLKKARTVSIFLEIYPVWMKIFLKKRYTFSDFWQYTQRKRERFHWSLRWLEPAICRWSTVRRTGWRGLWCLYRQLQFPF